MFEADDKEISIATIDHTEKLVSHSFMPESKRVGADLKQLGSLLLREEEKEETQRSGKQLSVWTFNKSGIDSDIPILEDNDDSRFYPNRNIKLSVNFRNNFEIESQETDKDAS